MTVTGDPGTRSLGEQDVLVLQHIRCEPPGVYEDVLHAEGARIHRVELDEGDSLPDPSEFTHVVVMGGPKATMTVTDQSRGRDRLDPDLGHTDPGEDRGATTKAFRYVLAALRLSIGWVFLWAFLDKLLALGFATGRNPETGVVDRFGDAAWINGGSPTEGFLTFGTKGPFADSYQSFGGVAWADWLFMIGLAGIGVALMLGIAMRIAAISGALLLVLMWTAVLPPDNNPFMDDHIVYALVLLALPMVGAGRTLGLGAMWERTPFVQRLPILK